MGNSGLKMVAKPVSAVEGVPTATRLNIGSGRHPLLNWCNIDSDPSVGADLYTSVPPIPYPSESMHEIFAGHYLEHLTQAEADEFLVECYRCLRPGGNLGIVVPDTAEVFRRYLDPTSYATLEFPIGTSNDLHDLDNVCHLIVFSTVQSSQHRWCYDMRTLGRLLDRHGFRVIGEINRWMDRRISVGAWYQCGLDAIKIKV